MSESGHFSTELQKAIRRQLDVWFWETENVSAVGGKERVSYFARVSVFMLLCVCPILSCWFSAKGKFSESYPSTWWSSLQGDAFHNRPGKCQHS